MRTLIALLVAGQLALGWIAWSEHSQVATLSEHLRVAELAGYQQGTADMDIEFDINLLKSCVHVLLEPRLSNSEALFCNRAAIAGADWKLDRPHNRLDDVLTTQHLQQALGNPKNKSLEDVNRQFAGSD